MINRIEIDIPNWKAIIVDGESIINDKKIYHLIDKTFENGHEKNGKITLFSYTTQNLFDKIALMLYYS